jgi:WD40 repeat protein
MPLLVLLGLLADGPVLGDTSELAGHTKTITCLAWSRDGRWLASGSKDGTVRVWDVAKGKARLVLEGHKDMATAVAFPPE